MTTYKDAGVDIDKANEAKRHIKELVSRTHNENVLASVGAFGAMFKVPGGYKQPVLVSSVDSVGTKLKLAILAGKHDTVGQDIVNHCVNDILCQGAKPLFFLDYIGMGKVEPDTVVQIVEGLTKACSENEVALIGGETAELPDLYHGQDYDLAGTIIGVVEQEKAIDGSAILLGDRIIGLHSNGLHTNGYTLARNVLLEQAELKLDHYLEELDATLQDALMAVHVSYLKKVQSLLERYHIKGIAHITGGGLVENIPRILPANVHAKIEKAAWKIPPLFSFIQEKGNVPERDMWRTFNMGIGMVLIVPADQARDVMFELKGKADMIGEIVEGKGEVVLA